MCFPFSVGEATRFPFEDRTCANFVSRWADRFFDRCLLALCSDIWPFERAFWPCEFATGVLCFATGTGVLASCTSSHIWPQPTFIWGCRRPCEAAAPGYAAPPALIMATRCCWALVWLLDSFYAKVCNRLIGVFALELFADVFAPLGMPKDRASSLVL